MDYHRIYREFIADRKGRKPEGYTERHHILPRSLGGGDESDNLIRLTPEDHIFAHLLLAKAYGGRMWAPINAMLNNWPRIGVPTRREIRIAAKARQRHALAMLGEGNPFFGRKHRASTIDRLRDRRTYRLRSFDGQMVEGDRRELAVLTGLPLRDVARLVVGGRLSAGRWYDPRFNPDGLDGIERTRASVSSDEVLTLYAEDGATWTGTRREFARAFGCNFYIQRGNKHCQGWHLNKADALEASRRVKNRALTASRARGDISGRRNPMAGSDRRADLTVRMTHKSGEIYQGSLKAFADARGIDAKTYGRMRKTLMGKKVVDGKTIKSFWGWSLAT